MSLFFEGSCPECPVFQKSHLLSDGELQRRQQQSDSKPLNETFSELHQQKIDGIKQEFSGFGIFTTLQKIIDTKTISFNDQDGNPYQQNNFTRLLEPSDIKTTESGIFLVLGRGLRKFLSNGLGHSYNEESYLAVGVQKIKTHSKVSYLVGFFASPTEEKRLVFDSKIDGFDIPFISELQVEKSTPENIVKDLKDAVKTYQYRLEANRI